MSEQTRLQVDVRDLSKRTVPVLKRLAFRRDIRMATLVREILDTFAAGKYRAP